MSDRRFTVDPNRLRELLDDGELASGSLRSIGEELEMIREEAGRLESAIATGERRDGAANPQTAARLEALRAKRTRILERREQAAAELAPRIALARRAADRCRRSHQEEVQAYGF
jgi:ribonuclease D